tara:strand:- start:706 stop:1866 length:1161 start_codon:yes stop_codon:yes gene_type:complete
MKICLITGSRAEYGLLKRLMFGLKKNKKFKLNIIVTGSHLSKKFGLTYKEIISDGFKINEKINLNLKSDTSAGIIKSINKGSSGFVKAYKKLKPDVLLVLGDRYEIFAAAIAANFSKIPIIHLHGGETTEGSADEALRHSITKMSHVHFAANNEYKKRIIQLGENPKKVFNVGGLGVDNIKYLKLLSKDKLEKDLNFKFGKKNILVNFHPETLNKISTKKQFYEILSALKKFNNINYIFTMPNADLEGRIIFRMIKNFVKRNKNAKYFISMGQLRFFSCLKFVDGMIGNSSSGILEMPTFKKGTINVGDRQLGRLKAKSVIDVKTNRYTIIKGINILYSKKFQTKIKKIKNPYGLGGASQRIIKILKKISFKNILKKKFYNLSLPK